MPRILETASTVFTPVRCLRFAVGAVVLLVGWLILTPYEYYVPPDFGRGFLRNKGDFFYSSGYFLGFYAHIGRRSDRTGMWHSANEPFGPRPLAQAHRFLGKVYIALVLCLAAPGGVIMAMRAYGGASSVICFALIGVLAWVFTMLAWRMARLRRFAAHGRWMGRSYLMICSAVMLRLIHYLLQPLGLDPRLAYQAAAWLSWVPALLVFEVAIRHDAGRRQIPA